MQLFMLKLLQH